jgi:hypothetical protein
MKNLTSLSIILFCISCSSTFYTVKTKNYEIEISGKGGGVKSFTKYLHGETVAELTGSENLRSSFCNE